MHLQASKISYQKIINGTILHELMVSMQRFISQMHIALYSLQSIDLHYLLIIKKINMKSIKFLFVFTLAAILAISSCTKDNSIVDTIDPNPISPKQTSSNPLVNRGITEEDGLDMGCFTIDYPFELSVNGDNVSISNQEDIAEIFDNLSPEDSTVFIDFVYPFEITIKDSGDKQTINNGEELGQAFAQCVPDSGWGNEFPAFLINEENSCFILNYPINLVDEDSVEYNANDEDAFIELIAEHEFLSFIFPISLTNISTQETVEVTSTEMLFDLLVSCDSIDNDTTLNPGCYGGDIACYILGFPVNYTDDNGEVHVANNNDELAQAFLEGHVFELLFPMTLIASDSTVLVVNNENELQQAIEQCGDFNQTVDYELMEVYISSTMSNCFRMVYPITITSDGGNTTSELENEEALIEEIYNDVSSTIVFPFTLYDIASDENKVFNQEEELFDYLNQCK